MPSPSSSTRQGQKIVRLRHGDSHAGWLLSSVQGREVTLKKLTRAKSWAFSGK
jgi:general secretion pathway protein N